jgi:phosphatidylglycerophosphatase C
MRLVFFDFDGTLTTRDTILPLGLFLARSQSTRSLRAARLAGALLLLKLRVLSNHAFKEAFCRCLLTGESEERIEHLSREFATRYVQGILRTPVVRMLGEHRRAGDEVYVVSSNFRFLLRQLPPSLETDGVIATEPEMIDGRYTGRLAGPACAGPNKLARLLARFGRERVKQAVAYGDSEDDRQLLEFVKTSVWV